MKKKYLFLSLLSIVSLSGCEFIDAFKNVFNYAETPNNGRTIPSNNDEKDNDDKEPPKVKTKIGEFYGGETADESYRG